LDATWTVAERPGGDLLMAVSGEIDLAVEEPLVDAVETLFAERPGSMILLDLGAVEFIDSSGIRALVRLRRGHGDRVRLTSVSPTVQRILDITGLTKELGA
jgi:anti-sigma B factor antagonist